MEIITESAQETQKLGEKIARTVTAKPTTATSIGLLGDLGSGKTTLVQGFARGLGITQRILSPTFIVVRRYPVKHPIFNWFYHIDLYRIKSANDSESLGLAEIFANPKNIVVIEWPKRLEKQLPRKRTDISFVDVGINRRKITVTQSS